MEEYGADSFPRKSIHVSAAPQERRAARRNQRAPKIQRQLAWQKLLPPMNFNADDLAVFS